MTGQPAFYGRTGTRGGDLVTLLHLPYTIWHLSYVVIGAALAESIDPLRLAGTLLAFALGLGVGAHALDELCDRPLGSGLSPAMLRLLGWGGLGAAGVVAAAGAVVISVWVLAWAAVGILLAAGYALEWSSWLHSDLGFALAWGAFPVLVGYWAQAESISAAAVVAAAAATVLSLAQRALSTPARRLRRQGLPEGIPAGLRSEMLETWERPLRLLVAAHVVVALGLVSIHLL